ncbi:BatD family protein [Cerasicoccus frondis]|uniref:BatD family protein n=1 Tax=Cerasicoccus frondis TaxID=490090 RepID=UPI00285295F2|nr:BatD family protein [Cerasicoccus frondis]
MLIALLMSGAAQAQNIQAGSEANQEIRQGQTGVYQFTLRSSEIDPQIQPPELPEIDGLSIEFAGISQGSSVNIFNGHMTRTISKTYQYQVTGVKQGVYTIPGFEVEVAGRKVEIPSTTIRVVEGLQTTVWSELELPREQIYVGEAVLAKLRVIYDPSEIIQLASARQGSPFHAKGNDSFTISEFGNQQTRDVERDGRLLREVSFEVKITPLKAGPQPMVIQSDLNITLNSRQQQRRTRSMFDQFFGSRYEMQQVSLYTEDNDIDVQPLPEEGRPTYFTGGIGTFTVDRPRLSESSGMAGEPLTMTLTVRGQGNFDRLQAPTLAESDAWRDYPPEEEFFSADPMGYTGAKTFEYTLIPRDAGDLTTPEINFNFFDPESTQYIEMPIPGQAITVKENPNATRPKRNPVASRRGPELLPIATAPGKFVRTIKPIVTHPAFLAAQVVPLFAIGLMFFSRRQKLRLENDSIYARNVRANQATKAELAAAQKAANERNAADFYAAAQRTVQAAAGRHVEQAPESLTIADIEALAATLGLEAASIQNALEFMEAGDAVRFGGLDGSAIDFNAEYSKLEQTVNALGGKQ